MEHVLCHLQELEKRLKKGAIIFLDYDGTLTPIVKRPELAVLHPDTRRLLRFLARHFKVVIISGRSLSDVKRLVKLKSVYYVGNHGLEISGPKLKLVKHEAKCVRPVIAEICGKLQKGLKIDGVIIEDKELTASIHYRTVKQKQIMNLKKIFGEIVKPYATSEVIKVTHGKKVFEIKPNVEWDKGKAVLWIIGVIDPKGKLTPIYLGDDRTDEDAFLALKNWGITVLVSEKPKKSHAKLFLRNMKEVKIFLMSLLKMKDEA